jgi:hypothetical protein
VFLYSLVLSWLVKSINLDEIRIDIKWIVIVDEVNLQILFASETLIVLSYFTKEEIT